MKKVVALALCLVMGAALVVGCTSNGETSADAESYTIGITQIADHPALDATREGFLAALAEEGFVEGENLTVIYESAQGDPGTAQQIAQNFVARNVDMIYAIATPSAQAAQNAVDGTDIPVVYGAISDPVAAGLADEDGNPVGNLTGISDKLPIDAQLEMIRDILPEATTLGVIYTTHEDNSISELASINELAPEYGFEVEEVGITRGDEVAAAADVILTKVDAIMIPLDNTVVNNLEVVLDRAFAANIPVFGSEESQVEKGCLASEGINYFAVGRLAGQVAVRVLKGADASTIPFETVRDFAPSVNTAAADKLGITLPASVLDRATEIFSTIESQ